MSRDFGELSASMKEGENTWNSNFVTALKDMDYPNAAFEKIISIRKHGEETIRKPDIYLETNGEVNIGSGKLGESKEVQAISSAIQYKEDIEPFVNLGEVFSITYPEGSAENFHLYILPTPHHESLSFTLETLDEAVDKVTSVVEGEFDRVIHDAESIDDTASRVLVTAANDLADTLEGVSKSELQTIFGGHDFFKSVLEQQIDEEQRDHALRMGPSYLFVNQVLFYELLAQAAGDSDEFDYPEITREDASKPKKISTEYFDEVRNVNYEPIYGYDVASQLEDERAEIACQNLILTIQSLIPKLQVPDLVGQIFQTLIPLEIRKPLGAHYTNPRAARLLARLAIDDPDAKVMDPACGSGTLLVAGYKQKMDLARDDRPEEELHRQFVEEDLTGVDAMMFSSHLAAVNLALEQPLTKTTHVRIATYDSTLLSPGMTVDPSIRAAPTSLKQTQLRDDFESMSSSDEGTRGPVKTSKGGIDEIELERVNTVIMNPPFTSYDNMAAEYRNDMARRFEEKRPIYEDLLYWKYSQQLPFLILADHFLEPGGRIAAVLPFTTLTGKAFEKIVSYLLEHYTIEKILVNLANSSFSEDTDLTEVLFIAKKEPPDSPEKTFEMVGLLDEPNDWDDGDIDRIARHLESGSGPPSLATVQEFPQKALDQDADGLTKLFLQLIPEIRNGLDAVDQVQAQSALPLQKFVEYRDEGIDTSRWVLGGGWLEYFGIVGLFGYRGEERTEKKRERLIYDDESQHAIRFRDRVTGAEYEYNKNNVSPAIRRLTHLDRIDVTDRTDFVVNSGTETVRENMVQLLGNEEGEKFYDRIANDTVKVQTRGNEEVETNVPPWNSYVEKGPCKVAMLGRVDLSAPGTNTLAVSSEDEFLLAAYGFMVTGLEEREAKLFTLWLNSTFGLLQLVTNAAITRGAWVRLEQYALDAVSFPDFYSLSEDDWETVEAVYHELARNELPDLMQQLDDPDPTRKDLDDAMLELVGIEPLAERKDLAEDMRLGLLSIIQTLSKTM